FERRTYRVAENFDGLSAAQTIRSAWGLAVQADLFLFQQQLDALAAHAFHLGCEPRVEPLTGGFDGDHDCAVHGCPAYMPGPVSPGIHEGKFGWEGGGGGASGGIHPRCTSQLRSNVGQVERGTMDPQSPQPWLE